MAARAAKEESPEPPAEESKRIKTLEDQCMLLRQQLKDTVELHAEEQQNENRILDEVRKENSALRECIAEMTTKYS